MRRVLPASLAALLAMQPLGAARADEFTDVIGSALEAYQEGNIKVATEELEYASKLLGGMKAEALAKHLPPAPPGWTRDDKANAEDSGMAMAMFGGGTTAAATYHKDGIDMTLTLVANSAMVTGIGAMLTGLAGVGGTKPMRIQRTEFAQNEGELQGVVDGKILVSVSGDAPIEDKAALIGLMDLKALADF